MRVLSLRPIRIFAAIALAAVFAPGLAGGLAVADEIVVTGKRAAQNAAAYSGAIARIAAPDDRLADSVHLSSALNTIAGVNIHRGSGQEHLTAIRSPVLTGGAGAGSFLYLEDSVPLRAAGFANVNGLFEAAPELSSAVEVVKGPGSVLYGSNAVHGMVNVISRDPVGPKAQNPQWDIGLLGNSDGLLRAQGSVSDAVSFGRYRLSGAAVHDGGFRAASGFDQQKLQFRLDTDLGPWSARWLSTFTNLNQETAGFITGPDAYKDAILAASNPNPEAYRDARAYRTQLRLDRKLGGGKTVTLIPYARRAEMAFLRHFVPGQAVEKNAHTSFGLLSSLSGAGKNMDYVLGVDAEWTRGTLDEFQDGPNVFSFISGPHYDYSVDSFALSGYGQADFVLSSRLSLDVGLRADWTRYKYETDLAPGTYGRFLVVPARIDEYTILTPKAALKYTISRSSHAYIRVARGARAPQTSDAYALQSAQNVGQIKSEVLDALEVGAAHTIAGIALRIDAYVMKKSGFFFRDSAGLNVVNGKTLHRGVELAARGDLTEKLKLSAALNFARHSYDFNRPASSAANSIADGDDIDTAPRFTARIDARYAVTEALSLGADWQHMGGYFTDPGNTQSYGGHDVFGARAGFEIGQGAELNARIENLFDTAYADRADFAFGTERYFPGRPRTVYFGLNIRR